jgi:oxygen-independent coproporphyrinogen III oxidase
MAGIYLHIPYCKQACLYCNFHFSTSQKTRNDFVPALLKEIDLQKDYLGGEPVETIYFGGGTPSLLAKEEIQAIIEKLFYSFPVDKKAEITLEANPDDIGPGPLKGWKRAGINRLSIGVQSFFGEDLKWMNRAHTASQARDSIGQARDEGFENLSIDLIFGTPELDDGRWEENISSALALQIPHLSCYALTVEPKTLLYRMVEQKKIAVPDTGRQARQFEWMMERLQGAGYEHYEISNFALPGKRSLHNSGYWQGKKYLGLGPSAHSYNGSSRQWNLAANGPYIDSLNRSRVPFEMEWLSPTQNINEYIMLSLRTSAGIDLGRVSALFGKAVSLTLQESAGRFISDSRMERVNERLVLTKKGKFFADGIAATLFFTDHAAKSGPAGI